MGKLKVRNSAGLVVEYGVGPGYRSVLHGLYRGVSCQAKEQSNLGRPEGSVKGGGGRAEKTERAVRTVKGVRLVDAKRVARRVMPA